MTSSCRPADGTATALHDLYSRHHGWLENWLRRRTHCSFEAAELAQDTFVRVLARRRLGGQPADMDDPRAYLSTIARGLLVDAWRRRDIERAWLDALAAQPEPVAPSAESTVAILQALQRIDAMLARLSAPVREAFILAKVEGLPCAEVAQRMGLSRATVERHIAAALRRCYDIAYADT